MRSPTLVLISVFVSVLTACSGGGTSSGSTTVQPGDSGAQDAASLPASWSAVYGAYFGPGTPGHCGNAGCHATTRGGFLCGPNKDTCYQGLVNASLVSLKTPASSAIVDTSSSPLTWFGGLMPQDNQGPNADAATALKAWVAAGAQND